MGFSSRPERFGQPIQLIFWIANPTDSPHSATHARELRGIRWTQSMFLILAGIVY